MPITSLLVIICELIYIMNLMHADDTLLFVARCDSIFLAYYILIHTWLSRAKRRIWVNKFDRHKEIASNEYSAN